MKKSYSIQFIEGKTKYKKACSSVSPILSIRDQEKNLVQAFVAVGLKTSLDKKL
ncbi:hypothetical protein [Rummeliibacillus pycnus]|uniref:hypothetical protein n=1 Tax=Rummeliibacillus pycnus TaxID=101070 RepID=UPI003D2CF1AE